MTPFVATVTNYIIIGTAMFVQQFQLPFTLGTTSCVVQVIFHPPINFIQWRITDTTGNESFQLNRLLTESLADQITQRILASVGHRS